MVTQGYLQQERAETARPWTRARRRAPRLAEGGKHSNEVTRRHACAASHSFFACPDRRRPALFRGRGHSISWTFMMCRTVSAEHSISEAAPSISPAWSSAAIVIVFAALAKL